MHEILTLQLGQRSNYLATHFWNTQVRRRCYMLRNLAKTDRNHTLHTLPTRNLSLIMTSTLDLELVLMGQRPSPQGRSSMIWKVALDPWGRSTPCTNSRNLLFHNLCGEWQWNSDSDTTDGTQERSDDSSETNSYSTKWISNQSWDRLRTGKTYNWIGQILVRLQPGLLSPKVDCATQWVRVELISHAFWKMGGGRRSVQFFR